MLRGTFTSVTSTLPSQSHPPSLLCHIHPAFSVTSTQPNLSHPPSLICHIHPAFSVTSTQPNLSHPPSLPCHIHPAFSVTSTQPSQSHPPRLLKIHILPAHLHRREEVPHISLSPSTSTTPILHSRNTPQSQPSNSAYHHHHPLANPNNPPVMHPGDTYTSMRMKRNCCIKRTHKKYYKIIKKSHCCYV